MARDYYTEALDAGKQEEQQQAVTIRNNFYTTANTNPDAEAKVRSLANRFNLPPEVVRDNMDSLRSKAAASGIDVDAIVAETPRTAQFLSNPDNVAVSHDDTSTLTGIEKWASGAGSYAWAKARAGWLNLTGTATILGGEALGALSYDEASILFKGKPEEFKKWEQGPASFFARASRHLFEQADKASKDFNATAKAEYGSRKYFTADADKSALLTPVKIAGDAIESLPSTLALMATAYLTKNAGAAARTQALEAGLSEEAALIAQRQAAIKVAERTGAVSEGAVGYGQTKGSVENETLKADMSKSPRYAQLIKDGYEPERARDIVAGEVAEQSAKIAAVVDSATNLVAGQFLGKIFGESGPLLKRTASGFVTEGTTEFVQSGGETFGQNWAEMLRLDPNKDLTSGVMESAFSGLLVGGLTGGSFAAVLGSSTDHEHNIKEAENTKQFIENIVASAEQSKTHARAPGVFSEFLQSTTDGTQAQDLYISAQTLQQSGVADEVAKLLPSVAEQLPDALVSNGYIRIPTAEYVTNIANTGLNEKLVDDLKLDPNSYTFAESQEYGKVFNQEMTAQLEKMMTEKDGDEQFKASRDAVRDQFVNDLNNAGRFTPEANRAYADMLASFYAVQAAKLGITPQEMLERYQLGVVNKGVASDKMFDQKGNPTPEFKQWFGDSKVVDKAGKPLRVYHGAPDARFATQDGVFKSVKERLGMLDNDPERAFFFASSKQTAASYADERRAFDYQNAEGGVVPVYLSLQNPKIIDAQGQDWTGTRGAVAEAKAEGYDGLIIRNSKDNYNNDKNTKPTDVYVAFNPNQIKSTENERPTNDPNILNQDQFNKWQEGLPIVDDGSYEYEGGAAIFRAYHGTTHPNIEIFKRTGNAEGYLGEGPYFTTSAEDASANYAGVGPDLTSRIEREVDMLSSSLENDDSFAETLIQDYFDANNINIEISDENFAELYNEYGDKAVRFAAESKLKGETEGLMMPVFVKTKNPADTTGKSADLTYDVEYNEDGDIESESGTLLDWIEAARSVGGDYGVDVESYISALLDNGESVGMDEAFRLAQKYMGDAYDDEGNMLMPGAVFTEIAREAGYDSVIMDADLAFGSGKRGFGGTRLPGMEGVNPSTLHIVPFKPELVKSIFNENPTNDPHILKQGDKARGQISFGEDITRQPSIISLLKNADLSTFIHEGGHFFLQVQADLAARIEAQANKTAGEQSIVDDMNKVLAWFGINGTPEMTPIEQWMTMSLEEQRPFHEKWARGFEAYAFEGTAPTLELQSVFQSFRAWLLNIYKQLKNLNVELSDEVRGVMDRMLATTDQIQAAEAARNMGPLFTPQNAQGIIDDWQAYHALGLAATQTSIDELQARGLKDMQWLGNAQSRKLKELQKTVKLLRNQAMMDARREVMSQPLYRAWTFLTARISEDDKIKQAEKRKSSLNMVDPSIDSLFVAIAKLGGIDREQARAQWGLDPKEKAPSPVFGKPVLRAKEGRPLDDIAQALAADGYITTDEDGKYDMHELEEKFLDELAGRSQYSVFVDPTIFMEEGLPGQGLNLDVMVAGRFDSAGLASLGLPPEMMERIKDLKMVAKDGIHPDVIAEQFGFSSGDELAREIAAAPKPKDAIEALTDQMMLERHSELATPEGLKRAVDESLHNEARMRALHAEAKALDTAMRVRGDTGRTNAKGQKITFAVLPRAAREFAENLISRTKVRDLKPSQFTAAEVKAAKAAERAYNNDDVATAAEEKRNQIINAYAAKAAMNAQEEVLKAAAYFRKFEKQSKSIDPDYYDQIVQMLERFDFAKSETLKAIDKRTSLENWLAAQRIAGIEPNIPLEIQIESNRKSYKNMTVEEIRGLRDSVEQIEHLGRLKSKLLAAQDAREFAVIRDEITNTINEYAGDRFAKQRTSNRLSDQVLQGLKNFWASHIKVATWARIMDGGKDGGAMWEHFIRPANERGDMEVEMRKKATLELSALVAPVLKEGKMGGKGIFFEGVPTSEDKKRGKTGSSFNKEARLAMALNLGNESNMQRLLGGEGWTLEQIKPILDTLTAADWNFVQGVWDHFESYRPMIAEKERRVYGKEPNWIQAQPLTVHTADNQIMQLRGGYYPVKFDPRASQLAAQHDEEENAKRMLQAAYTSATTRRSFTKERVDAVVGRPLLYSLDGIYQGVNEVIHDLAWHEFLIDTNRLIKNPKISEAMLEHYGKEVHDNFKNWIKDIAEGDRGAANAGEKALGWIRQGVSVAGLGFNVMSALTQPFGLTQSVVRIGAKYVGKGMSKFMSAPRETANEIYEMSDFMRNRALTRNRELAEVRNQVKGESQVRAAIDAGAYTLMLRAQQLVDIPTWWGAYEKATAEGNDQDRAVALADQAVIDAQASGTTKDLAAIERGGPALKLFTTFYTFFNAALNIGVERTMTRQARESSSAKLAADYLLLYVVPVIFVKAMKDALTPGDSDDWEDPEAMAKMFIREELGFLLNMIFGLRELSNIANSVTGKPGGEYGGPSGLRMIGDTYKLAKEVGQGEADDGLRKAIVNLGSELMRLPGAQINRTITGAEALSEGKTDNPLALVFGYQK